MALMAGRLTQAAAAALLALVVAAAPALAQTADVAGVWTTEHRDAKIRIAECGRALCGTIVWLARPLDDGGRPKTDVNNPDPGKRARPLIGLTLLTGLTPAGGGWRGTIYNADDGREYDVVVTLLDAHHARIKGCVLGGLFCGGETWTRD
jgi:uncharacterized protein (DUF2147 family)